MIATLPADAAAQATAKPVTENPVTEEAPQGEPEGEKDYEKALAKVVDELIEADALNPEAKRQLMADLRKAKPKNWPIIVQQFRSALAYRKQLEAREKAAATAMVSEPSAEVTDAEEPPTLLQQRQTDPIASIPKAVPVSFDQQPTLPAGYPSTKYPSTKYLAAEISAAENPEQVVTVNRAAPQAMAVLPEQPVPPPALPKPPQQVVQQATYAPSTPSYMPPSAKAPHDWQGHLKSAVQNLQTKLPSSPASTEEVARDRAAGSAHLRLVK